MPPRPPSLLTRLPPTPTPPLLLRTLHHTTPHLPPTPMSSAPTQVAFPDPAAWPAARVRATFIDFFAREHGHTFWKSASVIPFEDRACLVLCLLALPCLLRPAGQVHGPPNELPALTAAPVFPPAHSQSDPPVRQRRHEPVQVDLPRHGRRPVGPWQAQAGRQLAKVHPRRRQAQWCVPVAPSVELELGGACGRGQGDAAAAYCCSEGGSAERGSWASGRACGLARPDEVQRD